MTMTALQMFSEIWHRMMHALHHGNMPFVCADLAAVRFVPMAVLLDESQAYKPETLTTDQ